MPVIPWLVLALLLLGAVLAHLLPDTRRSRAMAAREEALRRRLAEWGVCLPKVPLSKPGEREYNRPDRP